MKCVAVLWSPLDLYSEWPFFLAKYWSHSLQPLSGRTSSFTVKTTLSRAPRKAGKGLSHITKDNHHSFRHTRLLNKQTDRSHAVDATFHSHLRDNRNANNSLYLHILIWKPWTPYQQKATSTKAQFAMPVYQLRMIKHKENHPDLLLTTWCT